MAKAGIDARRAVAQPASAGRRRGRRVAGMTFESTDPPDALVIDIDGDASIRMNIGEPRLWLTCRSRSWVLEQLRRRHGQAVARSCSSRVACPRATSRSTKDFVKAARPTALQYACALTRKADVPPSVVEEFIRFPGPAFLEVIIDRDAGVYPMVGPGQAYDEMITGDFIPLAQRQGRAEDTGSVGDF